MVQVRWTKLALEDLRGIYIYISNDSVKYAKIQILRIKEKAKILRDYPLFGKPVAEFPHSPYREIIQGRYRIIYKIIDDNRIDILTIHHSSRMLRDLEFD